MFLVFEGLGFGVWGLGFGVFGVWGLGLRVEGLGLFWGKVRVRGLGFSGLRV